MISLLFHIVCFLITVQAKYNILILNDIHFNNTLSEPCHLFNCRDLGKYEQDSPLKLIETVLDKVKSSNSKFDFIIVNGDFIYHNYFYGQSYGVSYSQKLVNMRKMWMKIEDMIQERWPGVVVINSVGNNDNMINYTPPFSPRDKRNIYGSLFKLWFRDRPQMLNKNNDLSHIKQSFMQGGYYKYNIDEKLSLVVMNANYFKHD